MDYKKKYLKYKLKYLNTKNILGGADTPQVHFIKNDSQNRPIFNVLWLRTPEGVYSGKALQLAHPTDPTQNQYIKHGHGGLKYHNGDYYAGNWHNNQKHGTGRMTLHNGDQYYGQWLNNLRHGSGTLTLHNGVTFEGQWRNDIKHGNGTLTLHNGNSFKGVWLFDNPTGLGTLTIGHMVYEGDFHPQGTYALPNYINCPVRITDTQTRIIWDGTPIDALKDNEGTPHTGVINEHGHKHGLFEMTTVDRMKGIVEYNDDDIVEVIGEPTPCTPEKKPRIT